MRTVGLIVNPIAGKDIRRLVTSAGHTSDSTKIGIIRRVIAGAVEGGASRVLIADDPHHLGWRAMEGLALPVEVVDAPVEGSRRDTVAAAALMCRADVGALVVLGGDGTCRDVASGWPDAPLIALSTGTNNVYPATIDATSAGCAAGFVASGAVELEGFSQRSKRVSVRIDNGSSTIDGSATLNDLALVDVAMIDTAFVGSRAVLDPATVRVVLACIASPSSTGLSSIAGRVHAVGRWAPGGVLVTLGPGGRPIRVPLSPGTFTTVEVIEVTPLAEGQRVTLPGPGVLAFDGERDRRIGDEMTVSAAVELSGPVLIDVDATLVEATRRGLFDVSANVERLCAQ